MAIDWIKMRVDLQSHPKVVRILSAMRPQDVQTKTDKFRVIGGLHAVWAVFDAHCEDGVLNGYTPDALDHIIGWDGFSSALISVGWLVENDGSSLEMPEFLEHNGQSAKRRAEDQKRKRDTRTCPQSVRKVSVKQPDGKQTESGLEKRRVEKSNTVTNVTGDKSPLSPSEIIFGYGLPLLTNAGTPEKQARSFLGGLRKEHGDDSLVNALRDCIREKPLQPLEWLAKVLPPTGGIKKPVGRSAEMAAMAAQFTGQNIVEVGNVVAINSY